MSTEFIWGAHSKASAEPIITGDQFIAIGKECLIIRNEIVADAAFMAKLQNIWNCILLGVIVYFFMHEFFKDPLGFLIFFSIIIWVPLFFFIFMFLRIRAIKRRSHYIFNRKLKKIFVRHGEKLIQGDWEKVSAGVRSGTMATGGGAVTNYALIIKAFDPEENGMRKPEILLPETSFCIPSNNPSDPSIEYVSQVWEYIRQFMEKGPKGLPMPTEPNWWHLPHHSICLTPAQAFRHYAPWRTGEPGEMQGKKNWLLPLWIVLFPYNLFAALCWWITCKLFRVRQAEIPAEALEGETGPLITLEMAIKGRKILVK